MPQRRSCSGDVGCRDPFVARAAAAAVQGIAREEFHVAADRRLGDRRRPAGRRRLRVEAKTPRRSTTARTAGPIEGFVVSRSILHRAIRLHSGRPSGWAFPAAGYDYAESGIDQRASKQPMQILTKLIPLLTISVRAGRPIRVGAAIPRVGTRHGHRSARRAASRVPRCERRRGDDRQSRTVRDRRRAGASRCPSSRSATYRVRREARRLWRRTRGSAARGRSGPLARRAAAAIAHQAGRGRLGAVRPDRPRLGRARTRSSTRGRSSGCRSTDATSSSSRCWRPERRRRRRDRPARCAATSRSASTAAARTPTASCSTASTTSTRS